LEKARRKGRESIPKTRVLGAKTVKIMSKHTEDKADKMLKKEREEMWERLGMNWKENSCLPKISERASFRFLTQLVVK
jgi:hypothetical protein